MQHDTSSGASRSPGRSLGLLFVLVVVGCTPVPHATPTPQATQPSFLLDVANIDGPPVTVEINGRVVGQSRCQLDSGVGFPTLTPGPDLALPWTVRLVRTDGSAFGTWVETGSTGARRIVIRSDGALEVPHGAPAGPAPMPSETCPP